MMNVARGFITLAVLAVTLGMIWGIQMAASGNHTLAGAHAHLNLVGFVTMSVFAIYYHLMPAAANTRMARVHLGVAVVGLLLFVPGIVMTIRGGPELPVVLGAFTLLASMLIFLVTVLRHGFGRPEA